MTTPRKPARCRGAWNYRSGGPSGCSSGSSIQKTNPTSSITRNPTPSVAISPRLAPNATPSSARAQTRNSVPIANRRNTRPPPRPAPAYPSDLANWAAALRQRTLLVAGLEFHSYLSALTHGALKPPWGLPKSDVMSALLSPNGTLGTPLRGAQYSSSLSGQNKRAVGVAADASCWQENPQGGPHLCLNAQRPPHPKARGTIRPRRLASRRSGCRRGPFGELRSRRGRPRCLRDGRCHLVVPTRS